MPGTFLGYPFDPEIFHMNWMAAVDPTKTAMLNSGAVQRNATIEAMIANGSNIYTIPFYNVLGGTDDNYDGTTDMTISDPDGGSQSGVVYGRMHAWKDKDFIRDFNSKANPMLQIASQVSKYWEKKRQNRLVGMLNGVFALPKGTDPLGYYDGWQDHTYNIALASGTVADANYVGPTTGGEAVQKAVGDNSGIFGLAVMHSVVAMNLAKQDLLEFRKYTDAAGMQRTLNVADWNGYTVIVDDGVHKAANTTDSTLTDYTTYILGNGAIQYGEAPVSTPVEVDREVFKGGGFNALATRLRETLHPNGFTFTLPSGVISPTDAQLATAANWSIQNDPKSIALTRIVSNG